MSQFESVFLWHYAQQYLEIIGINLMAHGLCRATSMVCQSTDTTKFHKLSPVLDSFSNIQNIELTHKKLITNPKLCIPNSLSAVFMY